MLGELPVPGCPTIWVIVGQGPTVLAVGADGGCLNIFTPITLFLSPSLWETARYRLKYCLKGPLNPKQPTNQPWYFAIIGRTTMYTFEMLPYLESPISDVGITVRQTFTVLYP